MINVLLIIPNLGNGGAQNVFRSQLEQLAPHVNVTGCVFNWDGSLSTDHERGIISLDVPAGLNFMSKIYFFLRRIQKTKRIKRDKAIQLTISHLEGADYVNLFSKVSDRVVCWVHGTKKYDLAIAGMIGWIRFKILIPYLYKRADKIITVSEELKIEMESTVKGIGHKTKTIYNGFNTNEINRLSNEELPATLSQLFQQHRTLIAHCRLAPQKNLRTMIRIFAEVKKRNASALLVLIGDGELMIDLVDLCFQLNLLPIKFSEVAEESRHMKLDVLFMGYQQNPFKYLSKASAYLLTSGWEGFPLSLCEAMACGTFVLAADCHTGPREIIAPEMNIKSKRLTKPYKVKFGYLMPPVNESDDDMIGMWAETISNEVYLKSHNGHIKEDSIDRVKVFDSAIFIQESIRIIQELQL
jgi:glycosyltransferase involved in cell wall biosynthesis